MSDSDGEELDISIHDLGNAPELPSQHRHRRSLGDSYASSVGSRRRSSIGSDSVPNRSSPKRQSPRAWAQKHQNVIEDSSSSSIASTGMRPRIWSTGGLDDSTGNNSTAGGGGNRARLWSTGSASSASGLPPAPHFGHVMSFPPEGDGHSSRRSISSSSTRRVAFAEPSPRAGPRRTAREETGLMNLPEDEPSEIDYGYETPSFDYQNRPRTESYGEMSSRMSESMFSDGTSNHEDDCQVDEASGDLMHNDDVVKRVKLCGHKLPAWMTNRPSWNRVAGCVVTRSPCFWYCFSNQPTDREILARLNILSSMVAIIQMSSLLWLVTVGFSKTIVDRNLTNGGSVDGEGVSNVPENNDTTGIEILLNFWNINGAIYVLGFLGFIICTSAMLTFRVIRNVNLVGAIRYLWVLLWMVPFEMLFVIGLFDYFRVTDVWIKHWWRDKSMAWFRQQFCSPMETSNTLCTVPILSAAEEEAWCLSFYDSTECSAIRSAAQTDMERFMLGFYWLNAGIGIAMVCLLALTILTLEGIVSKPLVQKSRESNVPAWFALPIVGCMAIGVVYGYADSSGLNTETDTEAAFIGPLFIAIGSLFLVTALLGWAISAYPILNTRDKHAKLVMILAFIAGAAITVVLLALAFSASIAFTISIQAVPISEGERGSIACFLDSVGGCTQCELDDDSQRCPQWSRSDVMKVIQTQAKGAASMAAIFIIYAFSGLRFGFVLRKHVSTYQIDYV